MAKTAPRKRPAPRTVEEKLRGIVNLRSDGAYLRPTSELVAMLGISERTIRRVRNQRGYVLAPRTLERIRKAVSREDARFRRLFDAGLVDKISTVLVRGKKRRSGIFVKEPALRFPQWRILQLPVVYTSQNKKSRTFKIDVRGLNTPEKIAFLEHSHDTRRFKAWHAKVDLRKYVIEKLVIEYGDLESIPPEELADATANHFIMIGPFEMGRTYLNKEKIHESMKYYDDAGRVVVEIFLREDIK